MDRRTALKSSLGALAGVVLTSAGMGRAESKDCKASPRQTSGPFYPTEEPAEKDNDLTMVAGASKPAAGQVVYLHGLVIDDHCAPVVGAVVEIWQACQTGRYNHENDPNPAALDPNFQYWGRCLSDAQGRYSFKTIVPGSYPVNAKWTRPPHIHAAVSRRGYHAVTTQLYFEGEALNGKDLILQGLSPDERRRVVVGFEPVATSPPGAVPNFPKLAAGTKVGRCDLAIAAVMQNYGDHGP
jgi:protocatechuate 3,4-dioxygenase beta subunit